MRGGGGQEVAFVAADSSGYRINGRRHDRHGLQAWFAALNYHGVYPYIEQHPALAALYPATVNTLRLLTLTDDDGEPVIASVRLRIGSAASCPVDNFERGGLVCRVDPQQGVVKEAIVRTANHGVARCDHHPQSGTEITGLRIPYWNELRTELLAFLARNRAFDMVGWDVLIGSEGYQLIEGNHNPGLLTTCLFDDPHEGALLGRFLQRKGLG